MIAIIINYKLRINILSIIILSTIITNEDIYGSDVDTTIVIIYSLHAF